MNISASLLVCAIVAALGLPSQVRAAWEIEPTHTHVSFEVGHLGLSRTPGIFRKVEGRVKFDDDSIELSSVTITIESASVDTAVAVRDGALRGPDWFNAEKSPNITFASRSVRRIDDVNYLIAGDLTVRGVTRPVDFSAKLTGRVVNPFLKVPAVGFVATAKVRRSDFGMTQFLPAVADDVDLKIALELNKLP